MILLRFTLITFTASSWIRGTHHGWNPHCPTMWVCPANVLNVHKAWQNGCCSLPSSQPPLWRRPGIALNAAQSMPRTLTRGTSQRLNKEGQVSLPMAGELASKQFHWIPKKMGKFTLFSRRSLGWRGMTYGWTDGVSGHFAWQRESLKCDRVPLHHIAELTMLTLDLLAVVSCSSFLVVMAVLTHWFRTKVPCILGRSHVDLKLSPGSSPERLLMNHYLQKKIVHQRPRRIPL